MKIIFLGTGDASTTKNFNSCFLLTENNEYFLIDTGGGNGILTALKKVNVNIFDIHDIFISHIHIDHFLGIIWIIRRYATYFYKNPEANNLKIYGNDIVIKTIKEMIKLLIPSDFKPSLKAKIKYIKLKNYDTYNIINKSFTFFDLNAYKEKQFGFKLADNYLSFIGDECCTSSTKKVICDSKYLIADAYMHGQRAKKYDPITKHHHSSVEYTAKVAESCHIKNLILTHISDYKTQNRKKDFINDAQNYFTGTVIVPYDLEITELEMCNE